MADLLKGDALEVWSEIKRQRFQVIAENLSTAVVADLQTLNRSMKDDRRKVNQQKILFKDIKVWSCWSMLLFVEHWEIDFIFCWHNMQ